MAIIAGGIMDIIIILILGLFKLAAYHNYGPFAFMGIPFFPPIAWTLFFILYYYLIPRNWPYNLIFAVSASGYSIIFANILMNLNIFQINFHRLLVPLAIYPLWISIATIGFFRIKKQPDNSSDLY